MGFIKLRSTSARQPAVSRERGEIGRPSVLGEETRQRQRGLGGFGLASASPQHSTCRFGVEILWIERHLSRWNDNILWKVSPPHLASH